MMFIQFIILMALVMIMAITIELNLKRDKRTWYRELRDWAIVVVCIGLFWWILSSVCTSDAPTNIEPTSNQNKVIESEIDIIEVTEKETTFTTTPELESTTKFETESEMEIEIGPVYKSLGVARITAYCSCKKCCGKWADSRPKDENGNPIVKGASGAILIPEYSVAVDPKVIPYGTKIYIDGKEYIAHDCGGAIDGNDIDIYFDSHEKALKWGAKRKEIFILVEEEN